MLISHNNRRLLTMFIQSQVSNTSLLILSVSVIVNVAYGCSAISYSVKDTRWLLLCTCRPMSWKIFTVDYQFIIIILFAENYNIKSNHFLLANGQLSSESAYDRIKRRFLPRGALLCKARYCDCMSSVRPSVTLVDQDHRLEILETIIARTNSPTRSFFVAQRPSTYSREHGEILGRLEVEWEKMAC